MFLIRKLHKCGSRAYLAQELRLASSGRSGIIFPKSVLNVSLVVYLGLPSGLAIGNHAVSTFEGSRHGGIQDIRPIKVSLRLAMMELIVGIL